MIAIGYNIKINRFGALAILAVAILFLYYAWPAKTEIDKPAVRSQLISVKKLLSVLIQLAENGGKEVVNVHKMAQLEARGKGKTKEGAEEQLTNGDIRSHVAIVYGLKKAFLGIQVKSEEHNQPELDIDEVDTPAGDWSETQAIAGDEVVPMSELTVWVDPLDATQEYTEDLLHYVTVMICAAVNGKPILGVVHQPFQNKMYWAWVGRAQSSSLQELVRNNSARNDDEQSTITISRSHAGEVSALLKKTFGENTQIVPAGGAGYKVLSVLSGEVNAYVHTTFIKKWDICAGNALLNAFGGVMSTLKNKKINYSFQEGPGNKDGLVAALRDHKHFVKALHDNSL